MWLQRLGGPALVTEPLPAAAAGMRVCVLERGRAYGPGDFPRTPRGMRQNFGWDAAASRYMALYGILAPHSAP